MSFYKKYQSAWDERDISAVLALFHPDYKRIFITFPYFTSIQFPPDFLNRYFLFSLHESRESCSYHQRGSAHR